MQLEKGQKRKINCEGCRLFWMGDSSCSEKNGEIATLRRDAGDHWGLEEFCSGCYSDRLITFPIIEGDKGLEKTEPAPVETFPGGFKVGDRVSWDKRAGTVVTWEEWKAAENGLREVAAHVKDCGVPFRFDGSIGVVWSDLSQSGSLKLIKETEPAPAPKTDVKTIYVKGAPEYTVCGTTAPKLEASKAVPDDSGKECKEHDWETSRYPIPPVKVLCIMCGQAVPAKHEKEHRQSMECVLARRYSRPKLDTWKCHCGAVGQYVNLEKPFTDCPACGGEVQDS